MCNFYIMLDMNLQIFLKHIYFYDAFNIYNKYEEEAEDEISDTEADDEDDILDEEPILPYNRRGSDSLHHLEPPPMMGMRRRSLADIIPDWPTLHVLVKPEFRVKCICAMFVIKATFLVVYSVHNLSILANYKWL